MQPFSIPHTAVLNHAGKIIHVFSDSHGSNMDAKTVDSFSEEWKKFDRFDEAEICVRKAVEKSPDELKCLYPLAIILSARGKWEETLAVVSNFLHTQNTL